MLARSSRIFVAWPFLAALALLLLNDVVWKAAYPGWLTGKLSDFAGLFMVAGLLLAAWPRRVRLLLALAAALFVWWKNAQSQWLIDLLNEHGAHVGRVVDPTDIIALPMLPLGAWVLRPALDWPQSRVRPVAAAISGTFVLLALMGTSVMSNVREFSIRKQDPAGQIDLTAATQSVERIAKGFDLERCAQCEPRDAVTFKGARGVILRYSFLPDNRGIRFLLDGNYGSFPFGFGDSHPILDRLERQLRGELGYSFPGMEFVIDISPPRY